MAAGFGALVLLATAVFAGQAAGAQAHAEIPEAPQRQSAGQTPSKGDTFLTVLKPCMPCHKGGRQDEKKSAGMPNAAGPTEAGTQKPAEPASQPCIPIPVVNWVTRFLTAPEVRPMTPGEKARLAAKNFLDPFNTITILGTSAISVGLNPHSDYGPGMTGFGRYVGVSYAQSLTGEFFGTFLIPSIAHQDPHYYRMPHETVRRRIFHAIVQVVWTQGDNGKGMLNYGNLVGFAVDDEIGNFYVPGWRTDAGATAERYAVGLATAPSENFVTEFVPDIARRIHLRVVLLQRIIDQVAKTGGPSGQ